ncbi:UNVERIFIED_CONTAM: protein RESISTANCE TO PHYTOPHTHORA 1, chloroplastic [Sesamum angustifolium]|uniref:Protein RESISTANCE TO PHYTOPHTHORA 1, chloroplastic n=1 Tax=Sesamum angustifolium TaxID=2727405 RepID=A0AAW2QU92_9LAMI
MVTLASTSLCSGQVSRFPPTQFLVPKNLAQIKTRFQFKGFRIRASSNELETETEQWSEKGLDQEPVKERETEETSKISKFHLCLTGRYHLVNDSSVLVVQKTAATFAPRASTASKNPAVPGTVLYTVFEVQGYASLLVGGALSFNLIFPSNEPDIWRLMGMWSIWMFTIPSLRARDCSKNEKEALNYLFLLIPLLNVIIPFFLKSFAVVWSADTIAFFGMYAWKKGGTQVLVVLKNCTLTDRFIFEVVAFLDRLKHENVQLGKEQLAVSPRLKQISSVGSPTELGLQ